MRMSISTSRVAPTGKASRPPLRPAGKRDELWSELTAGSIDVLASDHSPAPAALKGGDDFFAVWGGISGCQSLLPALLPEARRRGVELPHVIERVTEAPAERFGLPGKGRLAPGYDADFSIVDLGASGPLREDALQYRHRHRPYVDRLPHTQRAPDRPPRADGLARRPPSGSTSRQARGAGQSPVALNAPGA